MRTGSAMIPGIFLLFTLSTNASGKLLSLPCKTPIFS
jgi:hypothetical protein